MRLAIHAPNLGLSLPEQPFGKDVANRGLYTALATHGGFEQINFCTNGAAAAGDSAAAVWSCTWSGSPQRFVAHANG